MQKLRSTALLGVLAAMGGLTNAESMQKIRAALPEKAKRSHATHSAKLSAAVEKRERKKAKRLGVDFEEYMAGATPRAE